MSGNCGYCEEKIAGDALVCCQCSSSVHVWCLRKLPERGFLIGDVFFDFTCKSCNSTEQEEVRRRKLSWIMIVIITLHNLAKRSAGLGNQQHFHFRTHITNFIDKNWETFFPNASRRKRKNLLGTIAGILSQHSPEVFVSGTEVVGSIGWWKLANNWSPNEYDAFLKAKGKRSLICEDNEDEMKTKRLKANDDKDVELDFKFSDITELVPEAKHSANEIDDQFELSNSVHESQLNVEPQDYEDELIKIEPGEEYNLMGEADEILEIEVLSPNNENKREKSSKCERIPSTLKTENSDDPPKLLDRYRATRNLYLQTLITGPALNERFQSPYTGRVLQPFIYRSRTIFPRWLKMMCEIKFAATKTAPERSTIDFCYIRPHHLAAVNSLLQRTFWPGIDMSECLSYPDFTVVALYRKLVVGCAFLVPDACHNEAYISFLAVRPGWDRSGIASFMLYHLTQTSHGKDITLHVSASNAAICLYQKFGFKTEAFVLGFYEKYLPLDSPHSPHALLLRLAR